MTPRRLVLAALMLAAAGCAGRPVPPTPADPRPFADRQWKSPNEREHPLVGYALDPRTERWVDAAEIAAALAKADLILLGETHDNVDHHLLQAQFLREALEGGRKPAVAFEMFDTSQSETLARALATPPVTPDAIAAATDWARSGWPEFDAYRPIFEVALEAGLPIVDANLPRSLAREAVRKGIDLLPDDLRALMVAAGPPSAFDLETWAREMEESHCQELDPKLLDGLVVAQRARDAQMALRVAAAGEGRGAVLVTGGGHARTDRGVPAWLGRLRPAASRLSIGLVEVDADLRWPREYSEGYGVARLPFDFVVFTPRAEREDPCESLRRRGREPKGAKP